MKAYNPHEIEPRWQKVWEETGQDAVREDGSKPKKYVLEMFPYPSGDIHMGHVSNYTYGDVRARFSRMNGFDVWFDRDWFVRRIPPEIPSHAARFLQNIYRWNYEVKKLEASREIISLRHVTPESLMPYPGKWIDEQELRKRIFRTALARAIAGPERNEYLQILLRGRGEAERWAASAARGYFAFQTYWPRIMASLWEDKALARALKVLGSPKPNQRKAARPAIGSLDDLLPQAGGEA